MITEPITAFEKWYDRSDIELKLRSPLYRNILNVDRKLLISSHIYDAIVVSEGRLEQLVIPQVGDFRVKVITLERDLHTKQTFAYFELKMQTVRTKVSDSCTQKVEVRLSEGFIYTLEDFCDGNALSSFDLPPLILFQVKAINLNNCSVTIGPVTTVEI